MTTVHLPTLLQQTTAAVLTNNENQLRNSADALMKLHAEGDYAGQLTDALVVAADALAPMTEYSPARAIDILLCIAQHSPLDHNIQPDNISVRDYVVASWSNFNSLEKVQPQYAAETARKTVAEAEELRSPLAQELQKLGRASWAENMDKRLAAITADPSKHDYAQNLQFMLTECGRALALGDPGLEKLALAQVPICLDALAAKDVKQAASHAFMLAKAVQPGSKGQGLALLRFDQFNATFAQENPEEALKMAMQAAIEPHCSTAASPYQDAALIREHGDRIARLRASGLAQINPAEALQIVGAVYHGPNPGQVKNLSVHSEWQGNFVLGLALEVAKINPDRAISTVQQAQRQLKTIPGFAARADETLAAIEKQTRDAVSNPAALVAAMVAASTGPKP